MLFNSEIACLAFHSSGGPIAQCSKAGFTKLSKKSRGDESVIGDSQSLMLLATHQISFASEKKPRARRGHVWYDGFMAARLGIVLYWVGIIIALALGAMGMLVFSGDNPLMSVFFFISAGIVWGIGRAIRYVLAGE